MLKNHTGIYTDHYELTMAQGYYLSGIHLKEATFDYFFRTNPYSGGFVVFAGLRDLLELLDEFHYSEDDCRYLEYLGFDKNFIEYLRSFRFTGSVFSVNEGETVFPNEPVMRLQGNILELQLIETLLLNILNFESLVATRAARIRLVAGKRMLVDFGLRRAHSMGGIHASRAAIIGGFDKTSNVYCAMKYGLKSTGTMAHSWVQAFGDEYEAFRRFSEIFPDNCTLLADTYDTLKSGIPNAIKVGLEMKNNGRHLFAVRLDSGDLSYLAKKARKQLDEAGLTDVKIFLSNQLDEDVIQSLNEQHTPADGFGVGTSLVTGSPDASLDGVYKLSSFDRQPTLKISDNISKMTLPGIKNLVRFIDKEGNFYADGILLLHEKNLNTIYDAVHPARKSPVSTFKKEFLLSCVMDHGKIVAPEMNPYEIALYVHERLAQLPSEHKRFVNPHLYKVGISRDLLDLRNKLAGIKA